MLTWPALHLLAALTLGVIFSPTAGATEAAPDESSPAFQASRSHYDSGVAFYKSGDYAAARIELEAGYRLSKIPVFLVNLCIVAEKQNRLVEAANYCEEYLRTKPDEQEAVEVRSRLAGIRLQAAAQGRSLAAGTGGTAAAPQAGVPKPAVALLVGGGVLLIAGIATGAGALATAQEVDGKATAILYSDLLAIQNRGNALNTASIVFSVTGAAAAVAGAGWLGYWLSHRSR